VTSQRICVKQATLAFVFVISIHSDFPTLFSVLHMIPQSNYGNLSAAAVFCRSLSIRSPCIHSHSALMVDISRQVPLTGQ